MAAPAVFAAELSTGLAPAAPGGFTVAAEPSAGAAVGSVRSQSAAGGLVAGPSGPVTIVTAGAAGTSQQQAVTTALTAAAAALHRPARSLDVAPLPASDRAGLSVFVLALGLIFGALTGATAALIGVGFLGSFTFVAFVAACQTVTGLPGTGLAALAFIFVGNAVSGGTVPFAFLPDAGLAHPLLVLGILLAGSLAVVAGVDRLHLSERRRSPDRQLTDARQP